MSDNSVQKDFNELLVENVLKIMKFTELTDLYQRYFQSLVADQSGEFSTDELESLVLLKNEMVIEIVKLFNGFKQAGNSVSVFCPNGIYRSSWFTTCAKYYGVNVVYKNGLNVIPDSEEYEIQNILLKVNKVVVLLDSTNNYELGLLKSFLNFAKTVQLNNPDFEIVFIDGSIDIVDLIVPYFFDNRSQLKGSYSFIPESLFKHPKST